MKSNLVLWYAFDRTAERAPDVPYVVVLAEIPAADGAHREGAFAHRGPARTVKGHDTLEYQRHQPG
jgi:hypothetical protein